jgi:hypothetical protein
MRRFSMMSWRGGWFRGQVHAALVVPWRERPSTDPESAKMMNSGTHPPLLFVRPFAIFHLELVPRGPSGSMQVPYFFFNIVQDILSK